MGWMSEYVLDIRIWDVNHGSAMFLRAGNRNVVIDAGANSEFSPAWWINNRFGRTKIDYLVISHPHHDHIEDLDVFKEEDLLPKIVQRPKQARSIIESKIEEEDNEQYIEDAEIYLELDDYSSTPDPTPDDPEWVGIDTSRGRIRSDGGHRSGVTFHNYSAPESHWESSNYEQLNNMSRMTVVNCRGFKFVTAGDMLEKGIEGLMQDDDAMAACEDAEVLVAPHHGRDSSYVYDFVSHVNPDIVVFSEEPEGDEPDTVPGKYGNVANGALVHDERTGTVEERSVLTTREDGRIRFQTNNKQNWKASYRTNRTAELANSQKYKQNKSY
jgi:competence protein ComEC